MCGKSARRFAVMQNGDKPCGLKCHVHRNDLEQPESLCGSHSAGGRQIQVVGDDNRR
jgi:hypothetical protein